MKIRFGQIYPEIGVSFKFTNTVLNALREKLDGLGRVFGHYRKLFDVEDFSVVFIISATTKHDALVVKGPTTLPKRKEVEFVLHIPYQAAASFADQMAYALDFVGEGIGIVFDKYKTDSSGVGEIVAELKDSIRDDPDKYAKWTK